MRTVRLENVSVLVPMAAGHAMGAGPSASPDLVLDSAGLKRDGSLLKLRGRDGY